MSEVDRDRVELLAPAGDMECFNAAMNAGADAVYLGLERYSARAGARNFTYEQLKEALDLAHILGRKIYLTVNTLFKDQETEDLYYLLDKPYTYGLDGVIVQDVGVMAAISRLFPNLPIHVSTQAAVTAGCGADYLKKLGVTRIVPARELSLEEIRKMKDDTGLELECFIHGSLCYSYSGKCLLSSFIGGRSGNRGRCAQPCRLTYDGRFPLSLKDLCTIDFIPDLIDAGISSFKIEGRMKDSSYVFGVTSVYRKYIDMYLDTGSYKVNKDDRDKLISYYTRSGNCKGYYFEHNSAKMITPDSPSYLSDTDGKEINDASNASRPVNIECRIKRDTKAVIRVYDPKNSAEIITEYIPESARNAALTCKDVSKQLKKTGGTPFSAQSVHVDIDDGLFMSNGTINAIRRQGLEAYKDKILSAYYRDHVPAKQNADTYRKEDITGNTGCPKLNVGINSIEQFEAAMMCHPDIITVPFELFDSIKDRLPDEDSGICIRIALPYIVRDEERDNSVSNICGFIDKYGSCGNIDGFYVSNLESSKILIDRSYRGRIIGDIHLYAYNNSAYDFYRNNGITDTTVPIELNERELARRGVYGEELIVYGHLPMMISANCIHNTEHGCRYDKSGHNMYITDRKGMKLFVRCICGMCYNVIYNSVPISIADEDGLFDKLRPSSVRFCFTHEDADTVSSILDMYISNRKENGSAPVRFSDNYTKGHIKRGVE